MMALTCQSYRKTGHTKNLYIDKEEYQFAARMMLNHINCNMYELLNQQKKQGENVGFIKLYIKQ